VYRRSYGSTAGGVKVNTLGILVITFINVVKGNESISAFGRQLTRQVIFRAMALFMIYLVIANLVILLLTITEDFPLKQIIFETFSALSTVGLSTGITPELSAFGRLILIIVMFIGRLGPLAFMALLARRHHPSIIDYPQSVRLDREGMSKQVAIIRLKIWHSRQCFPTQDTKSAIDKSSELVDNISSGNSCRQLMPPMKRLENWYCGFDVTVVTYRNSDPDM
jgi:hypothetical protein